MASHLGLDASPSAAPSCPLLLGIGLGDLLHGLPINQDGNFTGSFLDLLTPYGLWVGVTLLALTLAHGAMYLNLKTTGVVQAAGPAAGRPVLLDRGACAVLGFAIWTHVQSGRGVLPEPRRRCVAFLLVVAAAWAVRDGHPGWGFAATTAAIARHGRVHVRAALPERHGLEHQHAPTT